MIAAEVTSENTATTLKVVDHRPDGEQHQADESSDKTACSEAVPMVGDTVSAVPPGSLSTPEAQRQRTVAQVVREVVRLLLREVAGDLRVTPGRSG